ncbi:MAG: PP2C family protein-serine/threonine phosphatase [Thermoanaerobaculia bacterium]
MPPAITLDDLVRVSDDAAVRRRFDERNVAWLSILLAFGAFVAVNQAGIGAARQASLDVAIALTSFVITAGLLFSFQAHRSSRQTSLHRRGQKVAAFLRQYVPATVIGSIAVWFLLLITFTRDSGSWPAWATMVPLMMMGFRMAPSELVLLHAYLAGSSLIAGLTFHNEGLGLIITTLSVNGFALAAELVGSRSLRKETVALWTDRRLQARDQIRMRDELQYARELQMSMLPDCAPTIEWLDWCGISIPATEVGGDYYDYFVEDGHVAIVSSDVAGHGLASGLVLAAIRSGFTLLRDSLEDPAAVLTRLHDLVVQTSRRRLLATAAVLLIDRRNMRATVASAGHPPILRLRNGEVTTIEIFAPPLGVRLPIQIPQTTLALEPGDTFIVHSDGIYESRNAAGEYYGLDRLSAIASSQPAGSDSTSIRDAIVADVERFRNGAPQDDDVTIVVCRVMA